MSYCLLRAWGKVSEKLKRSPSQNILELEEKEVFSENITIILPWWFFGLSDLGHATTDIVCGPFSSHCVLSFLGILHILDIVSLCQTSYHWIRHYIVVSDTVSLYQTLYYCIRHCINVSDIVSLYQQLYHCISYCIIVLDIISFDSLIYQQQTKKILSLAPLKTTDCLGSSSRVWGWPLPIRNSVS